MTTSDSMDIAQPARTGLTRRRLVGAAAWAAPAVLAASAVPAYAASRTASGKFGIFGQLFNTQVGDRESSMMGTDSYTVPVDNEAAWQYAAANGAADSVGAGTFTPGGTIGNGQYGGAGIWIAPPVAEDGSYTGTATIPAGARFYLSYRFEFPSVDERYDPEGWDQNVDHTFVKQATNPTTLGLNPNLNAYSGAGYTAHQVGEAPVGATWVGVVEIVTTEDLVATAGDKPLAQILFSHAGLLYQPVGDIVSSQIYVEIIQGSLILDPDNGAEKQTIDLRGNKVHTYLKIR